MTHFSYSPLLTDLYQLTMSYGYWRLNRHEDEATFHLFFRTNPFKSNYALSCGLGSVIDFLVNWRFQTDDLAYLATLKNPRGEALFEPAFLDYLANMQFSCDLAAIPEGTVVFAQEPLLRIQGPLVQCQLIESALLNIMNFQTLVATKASRICRAAGHDPVIEFGMRRAQGPDGALSASRAAYIGGCVGTSNTLAGKCYDIPVSGTHAHSWVTAFASEQEAFSAYASVMPHNCVLLVDTYGTLNGVKNAIEIGKKLRAEGADLLAVRLDSGDMSELSIKARVLLDAAGFQQTKILASNSLDEYVIADLKQKGAAISMWGVGTHLTTAYDQPALDGVYKLSALKPNDGELTYKLKLSDTPHKISNPGQHQVRRYFSGEKYISDVLYDLTLGISESAAGIALNQSGEHIGFAATDGYVDLLEPIFEKGKLIYTPPSIHAIRAIAQTAVQDFYRMHGTQEYVVTLEEKLHQKKIALANELRK